MRSLGVGGGLAMLGLGGALGGALATDISSLHCLLRAPGTCLMSVAVHCCLRGSSRPVDRLVAVHCLV